MATVHTVVTYKGKTLYRRRRPLETGAVSLGASVLFPSVLPVPIAPVMRLIRTILQGSDCQSRVFSHPQPILFPSVNLPVRCLQTPHATRSGVDEAEPGANTEGNSMLWRKFLLSTPLVAVDQGHILFPSVLCVALWWFTWVGIGYS